MNFHFLALAAQRADKSGGFGALDWVVLGVYFLVLAGTGVVFSRRKPKDAHEYFVGERQMPVWAVAVSVLATALSAATFIGAPAESYAGDLSYLAPSIGGLIAVFIVGWFFIPAFYHHRVTSIYELLEHRFGPGAKRAASAAFMIGRVFASGSRLYMAAIPLTMILFGGLEARPDRLVVAIAILALVGSLYTLVGGIRTIIWTEVVQTVVFVGAALSALLVLLYRIPAPISEIVETLGNTPTPSGGTKLTVLRTGIDTAKPWLGIDLSQPYTLLTVFTGFTLLNIAAYGADQDLVQRMLTCKSAAKGGRSAILALLIGVPVVCVFLAIGLLLYIFNLRPDVMGSSPPYKISPDAQVFPQFILNQMPAGLSGLIMAGLFAVALTSLMSALNAMSSTLVTDFYRSLAPGRSEGHYLSAGRAGVLIWGLVLGLFACLCVYWQTSSGETLIQFALGVMTFAYAGLLGVYFTALFTRRGSSASVVAALIVGFAVVLLTQPPVWKALTDLHPQLKASPDTPKFTLGDLRLAFPWRLTLGTLLAFGVCCIGSAARGGEVKPERPTTAA